MLASKGVHCSSNKALGRTSVAKTSCSSARPHNLPAIQQLNRRNFLSFSGACLMTIGVEQRGQSQATVTENPRLAAAELLTSATPEILPEGTKMVYFVRHAQGFHNVGAEYQEDAHLTEFGWRQVNALRKHLNQLETAIQPEVIIVSPLTRTLETACGVFGGEPVADDSSATCLMKSQSRIPGVRTDHEAIGMGPVKFVAYEGCRERVGPNRCDRHRNLSETRERFSGVDFSLVESEVDDWWDGSHDVPCVSGRYDRGESEEGVTQRGIRFMNWLAQRPESHIAVVSHCGFLHHTMTGWSAQLGLPYNQRQQLVPDFHNCELRSIMLTTQGSGQPGPSDVWFPGGSAWMVESGA